MKYLVVGAGFAGATIARELAEAGHYIDVIDKRDHIAGNAYDENYKEVIRYHKYGPHIFHTNNLVVFEYLSKFTDWIPYKHKVKALLDNGSYVTLPVNRETKEIVGEENIISTFFEPYTKKMWGVELKDLDPSVYSRVPVRDDDNEYYFPNDEHQYMPNLGYTHLINNMLSHENISIYLNRSYDKYGDTGYDHVFYSGPIDEFYDYVYGELPYRSIKFHHTEENIKRLFPDYVDSSVVNYTNDGKMTRITEWKNFPGHNLDKNYKKTFVTEEEPCDYKDNNYERYYPVKDIEGNNRKLYKKYQSIKNDYVTFCGRLGNYVYIDMDQAVNMSLRLVEDFK